MLTQALLQFPGNADEKFISCRMAVPVIDFFEILHVHEQDGGACSAAGSAACFTFKGLLQCSPVQQAGQLICSCSLMQRILGVLAVQQACQWRTEKQDGVLGVSAEGVFGRSEER